MTSEKLTILIETEMNWKEQALTNSEWKERALDGLTTTKNLAITPPKNLLSALNLFAGKTLALCILLFFAEQVSSQALQRRMDDPELAKIKANRMAQLQVFVILISLNNPKLLGRSGVGRKCKTTKRNGRAARDDEEQYFEAGLLIWVIYWTGNSVLEFLCVLIGGIFMFCKMKRTCRSEDDWFCDFKCCCW